MKLLLIALLAVIQQSIAYPTPRSPYVRQLTQTQAARLEAYTNDDKQNIWELSGQYQGDIILVPGQRNGLLNETYKWENNEIPYELDPIFDEEQVAWIIESLQEYTEKTCLTVRPRREDDVDFVYVTGANSGCWSSVGRVGGQQFINLQRNSPGNGCFRAGTIVHEFLHAAGFFHEQSSTERDDYVKIVWDNIQQGTEGNFAKYDSDVITNFGQPYDYGSVLHYSAYAFSINEEMTIVPKDLNAEIGQRIEMSQIDANKVNLMYCPEN